MTEKVATAIEEIRTKFSGAQITVQEDSEGGASVLIEDLPLGPLYTQATSWVGFRITFQYPYADVYPHFIRSDIVRKDGKVMGDGISSGHIFMERSAYQISRRSKGLDPKTDTAALKLLKVLTWLENHP